MVDRANEGRLRQARISSTVALAVAVVGTTAVAQPSPTHVWSHFDPDHPSLSYTLVTEALHPGQRFTIRCEGPDVLASVDMLSDADLAAWLESDQSTVVSNDGAPVANGTLFDATNNEYFGWIVTMLMTGSSGWLEQMRDTDEIRITLPRSSFGLPTTEAASADLIGFVDACEAVRFGRSLQDPPPGDGGPLERAALYEPSRCERCALYQPTEVFAGSVTWRFGSGPHGPEISARVDVVKQNVSLELHIWRTDDAYNIDIRPISFVPTTGGFDPHRVSVFASSDNVVAREQTMTMVDPATELDAEPDIDRHRIDEADLRLLAGRDLIELFDFSRPSPLILEMGETGRAVFAEAFAAWGLAP